MDSITAIMMIGTVVFAVLGGITLLSHIYNLNNIKSKTVGDGQHGTARFSTKAEIRRAYKQVPFTPGVWRESGPREPASRAAAGHHCRMPEQRRQNGRPDR